MDNILIHMLAALSMAGTACCSALVLSAQRRYERRQRLGPISQDRNRDLSVPFSDNHRLPRIIAETTVLVGLSVCDLVASLEVDEPTSKTVYYYASASAIFLVSWLYLWILALISRQHRLPSSWGYVLNTHLFIVSLAAMG